MNEITKIHLSRQAFTIAADAHKELQEYLQAIKKQADGKDNHVAEEVEIRMAELLTERGVTADKVVLPKDIEFLKQQLGQPGDFKDEDDKAADEPADAAGPKRLFRDTDQAMIAGVCAGLSKYTGIDVTIVRIIFVILTFFGGAGILIYLLLWLLVPEAKTKSERLQMQGLAVTVDNIKQVVSRADVPAAARRTGKIAARMVAGTGKVIAAVAGLALTGIGTAMFLGAATFGAYAIINGGRVGDFSFPVGSDEAWLLILGLVSLIIIAFLIVLTGVALMRRKLPVPGWLIAGLVGIAALAAAISTALALHVGPDIKSRIDALHRTNTVQLQPFDKVILKGNDIRYQYEPSDSYGLELRYISKKDLSSHVKTATTGSELTIDAADFPRQPDCRFICLYNDSDIEIIVRAPALSAVRLEGARSMLNASQIPNQKDMTLAVGRESFVYLNTMFADNVVATDNSGDSFRHLQLSGLRSGLPHDYVSASGSYISVSRSEMFELHTDQQCKDYSPRVYLPQAPRKDLKLNDIAGLQSPGLLESRRQTDGVNVFNCMVIAPQETLN